MNQISKFAANLTLSKAPSELIRLHVSDLEVYHSPTTAALEVVVWRKIHDVILDDLSRSWRHSRSWRQVLGTDTE